MPIPLGRTSYYWSMKRKQSLQAYTAQALRICGLLTLSSKAACPADVWGRMRMSIIVVA